MRDSINRFDMTTEWKTRAISLAGAGAQIVLWFVVAVLFASMFGSWIEDVITRFG